MRHDAGAVSVPVCVPDGAIMSMSMSLPMLVLVLVLMAQRQNLLQAPPEQGPAALIRVGL